MKSRLLQVMYEIAELLETCGLADQSGWFRKRMNAVERCEDSRQALRPHAEELRSVIAGMGSLSDLSLEPFPKSGISDAEANRMKWGLADELDEITGEVLSSPPQKQ